MNHNQIIERVYANGAALIGMETLPFGEQMVLRFRGVTGPAWGVRLVGLHLCTMRQSFFGIYNQSTLEEGHWEDWLVHYFDISSDTELFRQFLRKEIRFSVGVSLHDSKGRDELSPEFVHPVHVALLAGSGALEAICEKVEVVEQS
jgi:hypothetical protein